MKRDQEAEIVQALRLSQRFDAGETAFITRELLAIKAKVYETEYPTLKALDFIPMASDVDPYAENIAYQQTDGYGKAKIVANDARDLPRVNSQIGEASTPVKTLAAEYTYTWLDLQRSARSRAPLVDRLAMRARKTIAEGVDSVMSVGDSPSLLVGFTNISTVHIGAAAAAWSGATAAQMYGDMIGACTLVQTNTNGIHEATDLILPVSSYAKAQTTAWSSTGASDLTVLRFFQINNPNVRVSSWYKLETAGAAGVKRMIAYDRNADVVEGQLPLDYYEFPPQAEGLALVIPCLSRVGGVQCRFPKAIEYTDGM
jgi:hypothetical protein